MGQPTSRSTADPYSLEVAMPLLRNHYQKDLLLGDMLCPADARIQAFLDNQLAATCVAGVPRLPSSRSSWTGPGVARVMSLPARGDQHRLAVLAVVPHRAGRAAQSKSDRRTTQGVFHRRGRAAGADRQDHSAEKGLRTLLERALDRRRACWRCPSPRTSNSRPGCSCRCCCAPIVCPATGSEPEKRMEIRCFAPASLVSNLDFIEAIFGNGGDPYLPKRCRAGRAALDRPHRLRDRGAAHRRHPEEGSRPAARERGDRAPAATACAGRRKTKPTTAARPLS